MLTVGRRWQDDFVGFIPRCCQQRLINKLKESPNHIVTWYYDKQGRSGKTYICRYLVSQGDCCYLTNGDTDDLANIYHGERVIVFDFIESDKNDVNYGAIKRLKSGAIFSNKPLPCMKLFAIPHIICLANFMPDLDMLPSDRCEIYMVGKKGRSLKYTPDRENLFD